MVHTFTTKKDQRYRYYICSRSHNEGAATCPGARVPAGEFEKFVADQIRIIGEDQALADETIRRAAKAMIERRQWLTAELRRIEREGGDQDGATQDRRHEIQAELRAIGDGTVDEDDLREALDGFAPIWDRLFPTEQERILRLLTERVTYDPDSRDVNIELRPCGIDALAREAREAS
jgi:site-specific DNA recombinase